ncbi:MAG: hypothetical protein GTO53_03275, partial [Planctomycetales bacterium]|nr:hypothetical protein [Planctomycetales bacterium]NIM08186.1 hypothetical protein [Planctomycetales bacterium]NIN07683.1 hypothetical protein [Planctomycetales bacterium]NIN76800.1 hypothetical protein [Planctomycetales bacterium]NIO34005.1 hypothetical protein [Planctomycetales bacterium]
AGGGGDDVLLSGEDMADAVTPAARDELSEDDPVVATQDSEQAAFENTLPADEGLDEAREGSAESSATPISEDGVSAVAEPAGPTAAASDQFEPMMEEEELESEAVVADDQAPGEDATGQSDESSEEAAGQADVPNAADKIAETDEVGIADESAQPLHEGGPQVADQAGAGVVETRGMVEELGDPLADISATLSDNGEDVADDLADVGDEVVEMAEDVVEEVNDLVAEVGDEVGPVVEEVSEQVEAVVDSVAEEISQAVNDAIDHVLGSDSRTGTEEDVSATGSQELSSAQPVAAGEEDGVRTAT